MFMVYGSKRSRTYDKKQKRVVREGGGGGGRGGRGGPCVRGTSDGL